MLTCKSCVYCRPCEEPEHGYVYCLSIESDVPIIALDECVWGGHYAPGSDEVEDGDM